MLGLFVGRRSHRRARGSEHTRVAGVAIHAAQAHCPSRVHGWTVGRGVTAHAALGLGVSLLLRLKQQYFLHRRAFRLFLSGGRLRRSRLRPEREQRAGKSYELER